MAAIFYTIPNDGRSMFKGSQSVNNAVHLPFLTDLINPTSMLIVTEVSMQNKDTVQYFLTFNDMVTYFYFGKGLGSLTVSGLIADSAFIEDGITISNNYLGLDNLLNRIGKLRGTTQSVQFGSHIFWCVLSSFSFKTCSEDIAINYVDFSLQFDIVDHTLPAPNFGFGC